MARASDDDVVGARARDDEQYTKEGDAPKKAPAAVAAARPSDDDVGTKRDEHPTAAPLASLSKQDEAPSPAAAAAAPARAAAPRPSARRPLATSAASAALSLLLPLLLAAALLVHLPWEPRSIERGGVDFGFARNATPTADSGARLDHPLWVREVVTFFAVDGTPLEAWAYLPRRRAAGGAGGVGNGSSNRNKNRNGDDDGGGNKKKSRSSSSKSSSNKNNAASKPPVLVIGQGLGAQKDMGLVAYSEGFACAGLAVFAFDYRSFGGSGGEPRHWVDPLRHVQDWRAAVEYVSSGGLARNANVSRHFSGAAGGKHKGGDDGDGDDAILAPDGARVGLWGMSYSGGHVLVTAATPGLGADTGGPIQAVVSNEPFLTGRAALARAPLERGPLRVLRLVAACVSDLLRSKLGMPAVYVRLAAPLSERGALALLQLKDSDLVAQRQMAADRAAQQARSAALIQGATEAQAEQAASEAAGRARASLHHRPVRQGGWKNAIAARFLAAMIGYEPLASVPRVRVPLFLRVATEDHICPPEIADEAARLYSGPALTVQRSPVTHIEALVHGARPSEMAPVVAFYWRHLGAREGGGEEWGGEEEEDALEAMAGEA